MFGHRNRKKAFKREPMADLEDLRDDAVALFINSGMTQREVHASGGPTPATISKWLYKETHFPRMDTLRAMFRVFGYDFAPMPMHQIERYRQKSVAERLGLEGVRMPPKRHVKSRS